MLFNKPANFFFFFFFFTSKGQNQVNVKFFPAGKHIQISDEKSSKRSRADNEKVRKTQSVYFLNRIKKQVRHL